VISVSAEAITGVVGISSAAVAALGLLLAWYRHDAKSARRPGRGRRSRPARVLSRDRVAAVGTAAIVGSAAVGVYLVVGASPTPEPAAVEPLTEVQYRSELSQACLQSAEEARRIEEAEPGGQILGVNIDVEQRLVEGIKALAPPRSLETLHDELVATWEQRLALLTSLYERLDPADDSVVGDLERASQLTTRISELATSLDTPECGF
jgi:hypothetical protein